MKRLPTVLTVLTTVGGIVRSERRLYEHDPRGLAHHGDRATSLLGHLLRHRAQQELSGPASAAAPYHDEITLHLLGAAEDLLRRVTATNDAPAGDARLVERRARRSEMTLDLFLEQLP